MNDAYRAELTAALERVAVLEAQTACPKCVSRRRRWVIAGQILFAAFALCIFAIGSVLALFAIAFWSFPGQWTG